MEIGLIEVIRMVFIAHGEEAHVRGGDVYCASMRL